MIGFSSVLYYRLLLEPSDHSEAPHQQPHQHLSISQKKRCVKPNYGVIFKVWLYARAVCRTSRRNQVGPSWWEERCTSKAKIGRAREPLEPFSCEWSALPPPPWFGQVWNAYYTCKQKTCFSESFSSFLLLFGVGKRSGGKERKEGFEKSLVFIREA